MSNLAHTAIRSEIQVPTHVLRFPEQSRMTPKACLHLAVARQHLRGDLAPTVQALEEIVLCSRERKHSGEPLPALGHEHRANKLGRRGDRIDAKYDRIGQRRENRFDRRYHH